jgi:hypothetical protein
MGEREKETIVAEIERSAIASMGKGASEMRAEGVRGADSGVEDPRGGAGVGGCRGDAGGGEMAEGRCFCGGEWVFQGYREWQVMTWQGGIRVRGAYFTCAECGQGFSPLDEEKGIEG